MLVNSGNLRLDGLMSGIGDINWLSKKSDLKGQTARSQVIVRGMGSSTSHTTSFALNIGFYLPLYMSREADLGCI